RSQQDGWQIEAGNAVAAEPHHAGDPRGRHDPASGIETEERELEPCHPTLLIQRPTTIRNGRSCAPNKRQRPKHFVRSRTRSEPSSMKCGMSDGASYSSW